MIGRSVTQRHLPLKLLISLGFRQLVQLGRDVLEQGIEVLIGLTNMLYTPAEALLRITSHNCKPEWLWQMRSQETCCMLQAVQVPCRSEAGSYHKWKNTQMILIGCMSVCRAVSTPRRVGYQVMKYNLAAACIVASDLPPPEVCAAGALTPAPTALQLD